jgi:hypothetical protein
VLPVKDIGREIMLVSKFGLGLGKYLCFHFAFISNDTTEAYLN